jgi:predicted enzyme related to lactoylglutathione lyase
MAAIAIHGIRLNVANLDLSTQFFMSIGMVEDIGMRRADGVEPTGSVLPETDPTGGTARSISLRWPCDPYMHLTVVEAGLEPVLTGWPKAAAQIGSTVMTLIVADVVAELDRVRAAGGMVVAEVKETVRLLGSTRSAFVEDPDRNLVELFEAHPGSAWDLTGCSVFGADRTFLHFELNTENLDAVSEFYAGFGFAHNSLNDVRPNATYDPPSGEDPYITEWGTSLMDNMAGVRFLRLPDDPSEMHLEVMGWKPGSLHDPSQNPIWAQRGVMRYCFKTGDLDGTLADMRRRGVRIFMADQKAGLAWGDSEWFYFGDPDRNIMTFEQWFPTGHWGERY